MGTYTSILTTFVDSPSTATPVDAANLNPYTYAINDLDTRVTALGHLTVTAKKTTNYTANPNEIVPVDTTGGSITVTLPTAPAIGTQVGAQQVVRGGTNTVTLHTGGSDVFNTIGGPTTWTLTLLNEDAFFQYSSGIWILISDSVSLSQLDARYQAAGTYVGSVSNTDGTISVTGTATAPVVSAGSDLYSAGAGWAPNVYGYLFENLERDDVTGSAIMASGFRTWLVLLGLVPAGTYSTFKLYLSLGATGTAGVYTCALFGGAAMTNTSWARLGSGNVTLPSLTTPGLISTSLSFTLATPTYVALEMVVTTAPGTTYPTFAASSAVTGGATFLNPTSGCPVFGQLAATTAPASTLNPTTGFTAQAQKIWCALA